MSLLSFIIKSTSEMNKKVNDYKKQNSSSSNKSSSGSSSSSKGSSTTTTTNPTTTTTKPTTTNTTTNTTTTTTKPTGTYTTNTSYNGDFLTVDLSTDYTKLMQDAAAKGNYTAAAKYEAMRNAKVNYLNSTNQNPNNYEITSNYVKDYGHKNNQGGQIFTDNTTNIGALNDNWTSATINGVKYTKDDAGNIYANGYLTGDGYNADTGEFTYNNTEDAKKAAYDRYLSTVVQSKESPLSGLNQEQSYDYLDQKGLIDTGYVNAIQQGTVGEYIAELERQAEAQIRQNEKEEYNKLMAAQIKEEEEEEIPVKEPEIQAPVGEVTDEEQSILDDNSFETDIFVPSRLDKQSEYQKAKNKFLHQMTRFY